MNDKIESRMHRMTDTEKSVLARLVNDFGFEVRDEGKAVSVESVGTFGLHYGLVCVERAQRAREQARLPLSALFAYLVRVLSTDEVTW